MQRSDIDAHIEWLNHPQTRKQERAIAQLIQQANRLADYALKLQSLVYLASGPVGEETAKEVIALAARGLEDKDLDIHAPITDDDHWVTFKLPRKVWEYWAEVFPGEPDDEIRQSAIETYEQDREDTPR